MNPPWEFWIGFNIFVVAMLIIDLGFLHKDNKPVSIKQSLLTSLAWITLALVFNLGVYHFMGKEAALNFLAGYLIEQSLSIDNLFVFIMLFKYFQIPPKNQYKVLFWGIIGAIILRGIFIVFGLALINMFSWVLYLFGVFLIFTGIKMALPSNESVHPEDNVVLNLLKKFIPFTNKYEGDNLFVKNGKWQATPLFAALICVETTDVIFALDSIPAVMAITLNPFIIYTSNIFAILGLRSLYFSLSGLMTLFHFLHYGLAAILTFIGLKMLMHDYLDVPIVWTLGFILISVLLSIFASLLFPQKIELKQSEEKKDSRIPKD